MKTSQTYHIVSVNSINFDKFHHFSYDLEKSLGHIQQIKINREI